MSPKITKIYVEQGRTTQTDDRHWDKVTYGIEADVSDAPNEEAIDQHRLALKMKLENWLGAPPNTTVDVGDIPDIDIGELDACGWQTFKRKPAKPGQPAWIRNPVQFINWENPPQVLLELVKAIKRTREQKIVLGDMEYVLSGKKEDPERFINRKPVKVK